MAAPTLTADFQRTFEFVSARVNLPLAQRQRAIGLERDGRMVAGAVFEGCTGRNVWGHVASDGQHWLTRSFLRAAFGFPFIDLGVDRLSCCVDASNAACLRFVEHLGFQREATLRGAAKDGGDQHIYVMWRKDCRYG